MKFTVISILIASSLMAFGQQGGTEANKALRATIQKWVAVMKETQEKQKNWKEQKQILSDTKDSLVSEAAQLEKEIKDSEERLAASDNASKDKLAQKDRYDEGRETLRAGLDQLEEKVSQVINILPIQLKEEGKLAKAIVDHENFRKAEDKKSQGLNARLTAMLTILTEAEKFNQIVSTFEGASAQSGNETVLLDGAYFGLALGFKANEAGTVAFMMKPSPDGWTDTELQGEELISDVRKLINVANGSGETALVNVPLEISAP